MPKKKTRTPPVTKPTHVESLYLLRNKLTSLRNSVTELINETAAMTTYLEGLSDLDRRNFYTLSLTMPDTVATLPDGEYKSMAMMFIKLVKIGYNYSIPWSPES